MNYNFEAFLEIFYIAGYILEGLTVYSAYKIYGWPPDVAIDDLNYYNQTFIQRTNLDFFHYRTFVRSDGSRQRVPNNGLKVQSHGFQQIAMQLIVNQGPFIDDNSTPYYGSGPIDSDVRLLIDLWRPEVRYYYRDYAGISSLPSLNRELITRLIDTCSLVFSQTVCRVGI